MTSRNGFATSRMRVPSTHPLGATGWNVKPAVLLTLLDTYDEVIRMDSDNFVTRPIAALVTAMPRAVLVAMDETYWGQRQGGPFRTTAWGLHTARALPATVSGGLLRSTRLHVATLQARQTMMSHPVFLQAQAQPWYARPLHMIGDQEALTGLLGATDFAHIPFNCSGAASTLRNALVLPASPQGTARAQCERGTPHSCIRWDRIRGGAPSRHVPHSNTITGFFRGSTDTMNMLRSMYRRIPCRASRMPAR